MVQVLHRLPTFSEELAPQVSQAIGNLAQGYKQGQDRKNDQMVFGQITAESSPVEIAKAFQRLSPQGKKEAESFISPLLQGQFKSQEAIAAATSKKAATDQAKAEETKGLSNSLDELDKNLDYTGARIPGSKAFFRSIPGTTAYEKAKEFDALGFWTADKAFTHFNKGTLSKEKIQIVKEDLAPKSDLYNSENRARIKAIRIISGLPSDISEEKFDSVYKKLKKEVASEDKKWSNRKNKKEDNERPSLTSFQG